MGAGAAVNGASGAQQQQPVFVTANGEANVNEAPFVASLFSVSLLEDCCDRLSPVFRLPKTFQLRVAEESLDFVAEVEGKVKIFAQFPYQTIAAWGSNSQAFKISVFDHNHSALSTKGEIAILLKTFRGRAIEDTVVQAVRRLMNAMELFNLKKTEHDQLLVDIIDVNTKGLVEDWRQVIETSTGDKLLSSKQVMDIMATVELHCTPFEQTELACLLYSKILHRDSFQLVINMFQDPRDRDNLVHLLSQQDNMPKNSLNKPINENQTGPKRGPKKKLIPFQSDCFMFKHVIVADHISSGQSNSNNNHNSAPRHNIEHPTLHNDTLRPDEDHKADHKPSTTNETIPSNHTPTDISASSIPQSSPSTNIADLGMKETPS